MKIDKNTKIKPDNDGIDDPEEAAIRQANDDWIKRRYDVPGSPHVQALTILQPDRGDPKKNFRNFLKLPVSRYVSKETRRQLELMGYPYPAGHSEPPNEE